MDFQSVESSHIKEVGYDPDRRELTIRFHSGPSYRYEQVPQAHYDALMQADSIGSHFHRHIKPNFAARQIR